LNNPYRNTGGVETSKCNRGNDVHCMAHISCGGNVACFVIIPHPNDTRNSRVKPSFSAIQKNPQKICIGHPRGARAAEPSEAAGGGSTPTGGSGSGRPLRRPSQPLGPPPRPPPSPPASPRRAPAIGSGEGETLVRVKVDPKSRSIFDSVYHGNPSFKSTTTGFKGSG